MLALKNFKVKKILDPADEIWRFTLIQKRFFLTEFFDLKTFSA